MGTSYYFAGGAQFTPIIADQYVAVHGGGTVNIFDKTSGEMLASNTRRVQKTRLNKEAKP
jgi:hypothetical protein